MNVTDTPATGLPKASSTVATRALPKALLTVTLWGEPKAAVMVAPELTALVKLNEAGVLAPLVEALTL